MGATANCLMRIIQLVELPLLLMWRQLAVKSCKFGSPGIILVLHLKPTVYCRSVAFVDWQHIIACAWPLTSCNFLRMALIEGSFLSQWAEASSAASEDWNDCQYVSPSLIATLCGGLHASNSMEEVEVTSVSARLLILSNINIVYLLFLIVYCTCNGWRPFLSLHFIMHIYVPCLKLLLC